MMIGEVSMSHKVETRAAEVLINSDTVMDGTYNCLLVTCSLHSGGCCVYRSLKACLLNCSDWETFFVKARDFML